MNKRIISSVPAIVRRALFATLSLAVISHGAQAPSSSLTESAESVLRRVFEKQYHGALKKLTSVVTSGEIEAFGLSGNFRARFLAPDKQDMALEFGVVEFSQGYDGQSGWMIDQNGSLLELTGYELEVMVNAVYLSNQSFLLDYDHAGIREYLGPLTYSGRGCHEFRFFPPGGSEIEVIIDSLNGRVLLTRSEIDDIKEVTTYSDFRDVDGFPIPFRVQTTTSVKQLNITAQALECRVNVVLDPQSFTRAQVAFDDALFPIDIDSVIVPLEISGGHLFVLVRVNGSEPLRFLLDSGAGANIISLAVARELGLEVSGEIAAKGIAGYESVGFVKINSLAIGDVDLIEQTIGAIDLPPQIIKALGEISGALGYDFFSRLTVTIDFRSAQMIMYRPDFFDAKIEFAKRTGSFEFPLTFTNKIPQIDAELAGSRGKFIVDLGSNLGIVVHQSFAVEAGLDTLALSQGGDMSGVAAGVGGALELVRFELPEFSLGALNMRNVPAMILGEGQGMSASREIAGNLGTLFWKDFRLTLDYPSRRAFLLLQQ